MQNSDILFAFEVYLAALKPNPPAPKHYNLFPYSRYRWKCLDLFVFQNAWPSNLDNMHGCMEFYGIDRVFDTQRTPYTFADLEVLLLRNVEWCHHFEIDYLTMIYN